MNEDQASALFAPARERPVPPAAFTMADVFAADARLRRRRRTTAVVGTVAAAVLAVVGFFALSGTGTPRAVTPEVTPSPTQTTQSLASLVDQIQVPPNSTLVRMDPTGTNTRYGTGPGFQQVDRYWTSQHTPLEVITSVVNQAPASLPLKPAGGGTVGGRIYDDVQFDAPETQALDGPHVFVDARELGSGLTALSIHGWETVKPAKTADELLSGPVISAEAGIGFNEALQVDSVTGLAAQRLADDLNALWVKLTHESSCGAPAPQFAKTLDSITFDTASGSRSFDFSCDSVSPSPQANGDPVLWLSRAFVYDLQADFGKDLSVPLQNLDWLEGPQPTPAAAPANLAAIIDHLTPPAGAKQIDPPPDLEDGQPGYADQPGYEQATSAWTTTLDPDAAIAALAANPPPGMTGGVQVPGGPGGKGPAETDASYKTPETVTTIGPRLELSAIEKTPGITTIEALAWQIDKTAKPVRDTVTGKVTAVWGSWSVGANNAMEVTGPTAQRLADDVNALLVNHSPLPHGCGPSTAALTLTFQTSTGEHTFADSCGLVRVLPSTTGLPELQTSDALNLDVNTAFARVLPTPLPSSAPLPTAGAPAKSADEVITDSPTSVTVERILPVARGKQRMTEQTFTVTGSRAQQLVADLKALPVYKDAVPAGCMPDLTATTMRLTSAGRQLTFLADCVMVTTPHQNDPWLTYPAGLQHDLDAAVSSLSPSSSVDPPKSSVLGFSLATAGTLKDKISHPLPGDVTVKQDGVTLGTKHLAAGESWSLAVRPGVYTVTSTSPGYVCGDGDVTIPPGLNLGPAADCRPDPAKAH
jgi:hypothetical protein